MRGEDYKKLEIEIMQEEEEEEEESQQATIHQRILLEFHQINENQYRLNIFL